MRLRPSLVDNLSEALMMAKIRNTCASFMTRDTSLIEPENQERWYENTYTTAKDNGEMSAWLFYFEGKEVGYGFVRVEKKLVWLTGGILPEYRSRGLGKELFNFLINTYIRDKEIWLEVLKTNSHAISLYKKLKFKIVKKNKKIITMKL